MLGQCWGHIWTILDYVWPNFTSRPTRALKFSRFSQPGLISMAVLVSGTILGPYWENVWTMLGLAFPLDQLQLQNVQGARGSLPVSSSIYAHPTQ